MHRRDGVTIVSGHKFDGDTSSANIPFSDEAKLEAKTLLSQKKAYVGTDGKFLYSTAVNTITLVLHNCTGEPDELDKPAYQEEASSSFTYQGKQYSVNKVNTLLVGAESGPVLMSRLKDSIVPPEMLNAKTLERVDINTPLLVAYDKEKYTVLDGNHRLAKAAQVGKRWVRCFIVSPEILSKARI